jgi:hypothetical protein
MGKLALRTDVETVHYTQATAFIRSIDQLAFTERKCCCQSRRGTNGETKVSADTKVQ